MAEGKTRDEKKTIVKIADGLVSPDGIAKDKPYLADRQGRIKTNALGRGIIYHRFQAIRVKMMEDKLPPEELEKLKEKMSKISGSQTKPSDFINDFANMLSLTPWADQGGMRSELVVFGRGMREEKEGVIVRSMESLEIPDPNKAKKGPFG